MSDVNVQQSDIVGRKVFFLYPTASVKSQIITELVQQEYEVYFCKDHARLAHLLKKYQDSIVFVNIDDGIAEQEWEKWISTLLSTLPTIEIGIFSSSNDEELKNKYVNVLRAKCGFMTLKVDMSKTIPVVLEILKSMNTKGRRKYIRATTEHETAATMNMPVHGNIFNGVIKDISVVGISCTFEIDPSLSKNALFKDIQIKLQSTLLKVEAIVFGSRMDGNEKIYVFIFTQRIDPEVRVKIRKYIQQNLQNKMDIEISTI
jgi:hypothetical protein